MGSVGRASFAGELVSSTQSSSICFLLKLAADNGCYVDGFIIQPYHSSTVVLGHTSWLVFIWENLVLLSVTKGY